MEYLFNFPDYNCSWNNSCVDYFYRRLPDYMLDRFRAIVDVLLDISVPEENNKPRQPLNVQRFAGVDHQTE